MEVCLEDSARRAVAFFFATSSRAHGTTSSGCGHAGRRCCSNAVFKFEGYESVAEWVRLLLMEFWRAFGGTRKPPCANCYRELMKEDCPHELEQALNAWLTEGLGLNPEDEAAASTIDGKVLRSTRRDDDRDANSHYT